MWRLANVLPIVRKIITDTISTRGIARMETMLVALIVSLIFRCLPPKRHR